MISNHKKSFNSTSPVEIKRRPLARAIALSLALTAATSQAANISVDSNLDTSGDIGICTLRDAVISANTNTAAGGCAAGSGADVIDLTAITDGTVTLLNGVIAITSGVTVQGNGVTVSGDNSDRVFEVINGANATFNDLVITDGWAAPGGGVNVSNNATLVINRSTITGNTSTGDAGIGGGLFVQTNSTVTINQSTVSGNSATYGGGVAAYNYGNLTLLNSTVSDNTATEAGGGALAWGGGISLKHTTVAFNTQTADNDYAEGGGVLLWMQNYVGGLTLTNSIVSGNIIKSTIPNDCEGPENYISKIGTNLVSYPGTCGVFDLSGDPNDPGLQTLADNGGPTLTHAIFDGGVARNAATDCLGVTLDQRGYTRQGPTCDLGAYDFEAISLQAGPDFVVNSDNDIDDDYCQPLPDHCSLREAINAANANPDASTITFDNSLLGADPATITLAGTQLPLVISDITIQGAGITVDGDNRSRLFEVSGWSTNLTIDSMTLSGGSADKGGGVFAFRGTLTLTNSTLSGNSATGNGGGVYSYPGTVNLTNSTLSGNSASSGGGVRAVQGRVNLNNTTVSGNSASSRGGGIYVAFATGNLTNSTVSGNSASTGGGVMGLRATVNLTNSIIANSIGGDDCYDISGTAYPFNTTGANLIESIGNCIVDSGPAPITDTDPQLAPLTNNGGSTLTHLPMPGSPVIDAGVNNAVPVGVEFDQRGTGFPRIQNGTVDLGSVELAFFTDLIFCNSFEDSSSCD